jgi:Family of unknown function (DUF6339)
MTMTKLKELTPGVTTLLDPAFRNGTGQVTIDDYVGALPDMREVDLRPMHEMLDEAMNRFPRSDRARSDSWLGPRLHYALRLTRHAAARRGVWLFLAVAARPDYVVWRWADDSGDEEPAGLDRFAGPDYKHALARLWWMAEVFRNGDDYAPAEKALQNQDIVNNLFRMDIAHHRPTVLGAVGVLFPEAGKSLSGREANALAKAANAAATTLQFDAIANDPGLDEAASSAWIERAKDIDPVANFDTLPSGPPDPKVDPADVKTMKTLLADLLAEAPVRGRSSQEDQADGDQEAGEKAENEPAAVV